ncbi:glycoside hydrolase family 57 protein [Candidatus Woesearchaeota archaeon]|nr:glycoside hydrolase family 57 protein [Candidatus Woesearchaeota archaeon]
MTSICFYFQVHQPYRIRPYSVFEIGKHNHYFDDKKNEEVMKKVANKCYLPANNLMLNLIKKHQGKFKIAYSISGTALGQFEKYAPEVLESFKQLAETGCVEFLGETYYHSLSFLHSKKEFESQVKLHDKKIKELFNQKPKVFRNTELIYSNEVGQYAEKMGYKAILAEGWDHFLEWRSPNFVYNPKDTKKIKLLLKNYKLSDDIAFRFSNKGWEEWPLTAEKFASWVSAIQGQTINLFMDYETLGEHQWEDTGIFNFMEQLPTELLNYPHIEFKTPSELAEMDSVSFLDIPYMVSWADLERDLSAWTGNKMQQSALAEIYKLEDVIKSSKDKKLLEDWRKLQTSDHFYYMCVKYFSDGDVHKYFNPYDTPYESYIAFMNILNDIILRAKKYDRKGVLALINLFKKKKQLNLNTKK